MGQTQSVFILSGIMTKNQIAIIGLGYVGLPVALAIANKFSATIGFDINIQRVSSLKNGIDHTGEFSSNILQNSPLKITSNANDLLASNFFIVAVPTPISSNRTPDLTSLIEASKTLGKALKPGSIVVYESTVYPGVTEEICGPILAQVSGLKQGVDFKLGYSPERINPGDKEHTLEKVIKVVSGEDAETLNHIADVYSTIIDAGIYRAASIKVAEAAKVIENIQRDLNIALMNELALIFDRLDISTRDVLSAARTKWNFLPFSPGLVGGHCICVDPYYLTTKAEEVGYHPQVILAGRRINDGMGAYIAQRCVKLLTQIGTPIKGAKVSILGLTFKEDVSDIRNSRVPDIIHELNEFGIQALVHDPLANPQESEHTYGIQLAEWQDLQDLDALILAVPHRLYINSVNYNLFACLKSNAVLMDIKSVLNLSDLAEDITYWSL
jgi:UDP-N-acetyl-D-glucosamine/UDP-N-acetyl-D-galactosamine dehydrogenase